MLKIKAGFTYFTIQSISRNDVFITNKTNLLGQDLNELH